MEKIGFEGLSICFMSNGRISHPQVVYTHRFLKTTENMTPESSVGATPPTHGGAVKAKVQRVCVHVCVFIRGHPAVTPALMHWLQGE